MREPNRKAHKLKAFSHVGTAGAVEDARRRIAKVRQANQCGAYLLCDAGGFLYLLRETSETAVMWLAKAPEMFIGMYRTAPGAEQLLADIEETLSQRANALI